MGGKPLLDTGLAAKGFVEAAAAIGGNASLLALFADSFVSSFFENALNGEGDVADMGGKALFDIGLVAKGMVGAADAIGGNALPVLFVDSFVSSFFENALNGEGDVADMGGKALFDNCFVAKEASDDRGGVRESLCFVTSIFDDETFPANKKPPEPTLSLFTPAAD